MTCSNQSLPYFLYSFTQCRWADLWWLVSHGTFFATHLWYPASAKTFRTVPLLTFRSTKFLISAKGFQHALVASRTMEHFIRSVTMVWQPEWGRLLVEPCCWYFCQIFFAVGYGISESSAASAMVLPPVMIPMRHFFRRVMLASRCLHGSHMGVRNNVYVYVEYVTFFQNEASISRCLCKDHYFLWAWVSPPSLGKAQLTWEALKLMRKVFQANRLVGHQKYIEDAMSFLKPSLMSWRRLISWHRPQHYC